MQKQPKVEIMLAVLFFAKLVKIMLVITNYTKTYASTIYQSPAFSRSTQCVEPAKTLTHLMNELVLFVASIYIEALNASHFSFSLAFTEET